MDGLEEFLKNFVKQLNDDDADLITADTNFRRLGSWDSLASVLVENMLYKKYQVSLEENQIYTVNTIGELFLLVKEKQNG